MIPFVLNIPKEFKKFTRFIYDKERSQDKRIRESATQYLLGLLLVTGRKDCSKLERLYDRGQGSSFRRLLNRTGLYVVAWIDEALDKVFSGLSVKPGSTVILAIDTVFLGHKGGKKIENSHLFRPNGKRRIRAHALVVPALIVDGVAIPLQPKFYLTEKYAEKKKKNFKSQIDLAIEIIKEFVPFSNTKTIVLLDSFFDCDMVYRCCTDRNFGFIVCLKRSRVIMDPDERYVPREDYCFEDGVSLKYYCEELVRHRAFGKIRVPRVGKKGKYKEFYAYKQLGDILNISEQAGLPINLLFSGKKAKQGRQIRVFATNLLTLSEVQISTIYSFRWQIECLFKFMKQNLGLGDCQAYSWRARTNHIRLVFVAYLFLVHTRLRQHGTLRPTDRQSTEFAGLFGQLMQFREQAFAEQFDSLLCAAESRRARPSLVKVVRGIFRRTIKSRRVA